MIHPLFVAIPDADALLALEPEELASRLLFLLHDLPVAMDVQHGKFHAGNMYSAMRRTTPDAMSRRVDEILLAVREGIAWLIAQGLLIPVEDGTQWLTLSRRAAKLQTEAQFRGFAFSRMLPAEALHPRIKGVWQDFVRGDFETAAFKSMKAVEVSLREASAAGAGRSGVELARFAFHPATGPLTDHQAEGGEKEAVAHLFAGVFGTLKNPLSHRDVDLANPADAAAVIMFAGYLLRVVDARRWPPLGEE